MDAAICPMSNIALEAMLASTSALHCAIDTPTWEIDLDRRELLANLVGDQAPHRANVVLGVRVSLYSDIPSSGGPNRF